MADGDRYSREESEEERLDRNLLELLNELRVALPGVQVLFAFLLIVPFSAALRRRSPRRRRRSTTRRCWRRPIAALLLIAPSAHHRINFRQQDKAYIVFLANKLTIAGLAFLAIAMTLRRVADHRPALQQHGDGDRDRRHRALLRGALVRRADRAARPPQPRRAPT